MTNGRYSVFLILSFVLISPIFAAENEIPEQVGKYADDQMEIHVSKQGRSVGSAERTVTVKAAGKKSAIVYNVHYSFSYGTFWCSIAVSDKKGKLSVSEKPSCFENEMP